MTGSLLQALTLPRARNSNTKLILQAPFVLGRIAELPFIQTRNWFSEADLNAACRFALSFADFRQESWL